MKYRKKPVVIDAIQWTGENRHELERFITTRRDMLSHSTVISIHTLEGTMRAEIGDYIIKGVQGEFYPCKPDIFEATYEKVSE
jgi:hypothetical protein